MFKPLAYSKSLAVLAAAVLVITLDPALRMLLTGVRRFCFRPATLSRTLNALLMGRIQQEDENPFSRFLMHCYEPVVTWTLRHKWTVLAGAALLVLTTVPVFLALGSEYMPPMDEGALLYMPTTLPGISVSQARRVVQATDSILKQFPEVDHALGKAGRAGTATDPAPLSMLETLITLKPRSQWRHVDTWYSTWAPGWAKAILRRVTPDTISTEELVREMDSALKVPGVANAWTMPIKGRVDMLTSGMRTPLGLKISGRDSKTIEEIGQHLQAVLPLVRGTRGVFAEHPDAGYYIDVNWRREQLARYGVSMEEAQQIVNSAVGGDNVSSVFEGAEKYPVNVRYMRDYRDNLEALGSILVPAGNQRQVPISELATLQITNGPSMIRDENGVLTGYVYIDLADRDPGSYIAEANELLQKQVKLPAGFVVSWSGQYEAMARVNQRLRYVIPGTLGLVMLLIYLGTRSMAKTAIVMLAVPFSTIGAAWLLYLLHYNLSVAVWVGVIGLLSIDAETGMFMLLYLDLACEDARKRDRLRSIGELRQAIIYGAAKRLRPKFMTFATTCLGLLPVMWSIGAGSDVLKRIAAPMVGGISTSFLLELIAYPAIYELWKRRSVLAKSTHMLEPLAVQEKTLVLSTNGD